MVVSTGTASGKSLVYLVPTLTAVVEGLASPTGRGATALYLSPTKALAADQLSRLTSVAVPGVRAATYDGDTPTEERRWARDHAHLILSNPDLVHHSMLPRHRQWSRFLRALRFVVVDECHVYRGVFGSHLAAVLRRLRRVCARYGAHPTFVLASATVRDPDRHASRLVGMPVEAVTRDGSPRGAMTFALWEIAAGSPLPEHSHPHEQVVHLYEGEFEMTVDGETRRMRGGSVFAIPSNARHSGRAITDCRIMDVFRPVREDYRDGAAETIIGKAAHTG